MTKLSLLDKMIREFAPRRAYERLQYKQAFDIRAGGYSGALTSRYRSHQAWNRSYSATEDTLLGSRDRMALRLECLDLWRNNEIVRGVVDRFVDYSVSSGIWPQAQTSNIKWNKDSEDWWREVYAPTIDFRQIQGVDIVSHQGHIVANRLLTGETGFIMIDNGQLLPVEADNICTPSKFSADKNVVEGVRRSASGVVTGYYVCPRQNGGAPDTTKFNYVRKENFIHCFRPGRIDQLRGIPAFAPAINKLIDYDQTDQNVFNKIKYDSQIVGIIKTSSGFANERNRDQYMLTNSDSKDQQKVEKREWGMEISLAPDEEMNALDSKTPNQQYVQYLEHELKTIASCVNLPFEFVMLIFTSGSYSAQRAAMLHAQNTFTKEHDWVVKVFLQRLWNWRIAKAMKAGDLPPAPITNGKSEWYKVTWSQPWFGWIDPQKQVNAQRDRIRLGISSLKIEARSEGQEVDDIMEDQMQVMLAAQRRADEMNTRMPSGNWTWKDFVDTGRPVDKGLEALAMNDEGENNA